MQEYELVSLRSFIAVVDAGSFNQAADLLGASTAAVSRRISGLEAALGIRLLNRTTRKIELTEAGQQFYGDVSNILLSLAEAEEKLQQGRQSVKGTLRVAAPLSFGIHCLSPILPELQKQYPALRIQLELDDRRTDLVAERIDVAIRIGRLADSSLVATSIGSIPRVFCASPGYLAEQGEPKRPEELISHNCLHYSLISPRDEWRFQENGNLINVDVSGSLSTNNGDVLKDAALNGIGIALLPRFIVAEALANGRLKAILPEFVPQPLGMYAVRLSRKFTPVKVNIFIEHLKQHFAS